MVGRVLTENRYSEAIDILYMRNTFDFHNLDEVLRFSLTVLPERFQSIRSVEWMSVPPFTGSIYPFPTFKTNY